MKSGLDEERFGMIMSLCVILGSRVLEWCSQTEMYLDSGNFVVERCCYGDCIPLLLCPHLCPHLCPVLASLHGFPLV